MKIGDEVTVPNRDGSWVICEDMGLNYSPRGGRHWRCKQRRSVGAGTMFTSQALGESAMHLVNSRTFASGDVVYHGGGPDNGAEFKVIADGDVRVRVRGADGVREIPRGELVLENL